MMVMMGEVPGVVGGPGQGADLYRIWEGFQEEQHLSWILKYKHELTSWKGAGRCSRLTEGPDAREVWLLESMKEVLHWFSLQLQQAIRWGEVNKVRSWRVFKLWSRVWTFFWGQLVAIKHPNWESEYFIKWLGCSVNNRKKAGGREVRWLVQ